MIDLDRLWPMAARLEAYRLRNLRAQPLVARWMMRGRGRGHFHFVLCLVHERKKTSEDF